MFDNETNIYVREYNRNITGCNKKCPCKGNWVNCPQYVDITKQQTRLKRKVDEHYKLVHSWYETNFRIQYVYSDIFGNG